jgi:hypothetical protein
MNIYLFDQPAEYEYSDKIMAEQWPNIVASLEYISYDFSYQSSHQRKNYCCKLRKVLGENLEALSTKYEVLVPVPVA